MLDTNTNTTATAEVKLIFNFYNLEYSGYFILISCVYIFGIRHGSKLK